MSEIKKGIKVGTKVVSDAGERVEVQSLELNQYVTTYSIESESKSSVTLIELQKNIVSEVMYITTSSGDLFVCGDETEIYTLSGWKIAKDLAIGDVVLNLELEEKTILDIEIVSESTELYSLSLQSNLDDVISTYFASNNGVLIR